MHAADNAAIYGFPLSMPRLGRPGTSPAGASRSGLGVCSVLVPTACPVPRPAGSRLCFGGSSSSPDPWAGQILLNMTAVMHPSE